MNTQIKCVVVGISLTILKHVEMFNMPMFQTDLHHSCGNISGTSFSFRIRWKANSSILRTAVGTVKTTVSSWEGVNKIARYLMTTVPPQTRRVRPKNGL